MTYTFGEKKTEYSVKSGKEIPVLVAEKYKNTKAKAIEIIESGKYGVLESDFWILMNETKSGKMMYTGLIISHNACLKINDKLDNKFVPSCVSVDKGGYANSLVYSYCNDEQGIYEVGEVSKDNCKNSYPYAMAYKRLFDRVVLKLSKLAFAGVYSETESDEFRQDYNDAPAPAAEPVKYTPKNKKAPSNLEQLFKCESCGSQITETKGKDGSTVSVDEIVKISRDKTGKTLCATCLKRNAK